MAIVTTADNWSELSAGFATLERVLRDEGGEHLLPGVRSINRVLAGVSPHAPDAQAALADARSTYRNLLSHKGLLADFYIWRDDFDERQKANVVFTGLVDRLGRLLASSDSAVST